jgi:O-antigen/teichoic acid export membrane protein
MGFSFLPGPALLSRLRHPNSTAALQLFQVLRLGSLLLSSVLLAKSGLSTADIGAYEMLLYVGGTLSFLWVNGLLQGIVPLHAHMAEDMRKRFIFNIFLVFNALSAGLFALLVLAEPLVVPLLTGQPTLPHYALFCGFLLFNLPTYTLEYFYLLQDRPWRIIGWGIASFGGQMAAFFLPLWAGMGLGAAFGAWLALALLKWLWALGLVWRIGHWRFDWPLVRRYLRFSAPLVANLLVGNLVLVFDAWLVGWYYADPAVFAIFKYGSRELPLATALATALSVSMIPQIAASEAQGLAQLRQKGRRLMHGLFPLSMALMLCSGWLFPRLFNPDFAASAPLFNIYLLMTASRLLLPNAIVLAKGEPRVILQVSLLELVAKVVLGLLGLHWFGLPGLAWSAVLAFWVEKIGLMWHLQRTHQIPVARWLDIPLFAGYCAALLITFLMENL